MKKNFDSTNNLTADQMKLLAAGHFEDFRKAIAYVNGKCGRCLSFDECADLELEAYVKACDRAATYNPAKGSITGWFWKIAHNAACDYLKKKAQQVRLINDGYYGTDDDGAMQRGHLTRSERDQLTIAGWCVCEETLSFEDKRKYRLQRECWCAAFKSLSDRDQMLLHMRWNLKLSGEKMAQELHMGHVALRVALSRALERFKAELIARHFKDIDEWTSRNSAWDSWPRIEKDIMASGYSSGISA